jgi:hypothetical protein
MEKSKKELKLEHKILKKKKLTSTMFIFEYYEDIIKDLKENENILALTYYNKWKVVLTDERIMIRSTRFDKTKKSVNINYKDIDIKSLKKDNLNIHFTLKNKEYSFQDIRNKNLLDILKLKIEESKGKNINQLDENKSLTIEKPSDNKRNKKDSKNIEKISSTIEKIKNKGAWDFLVKYVENYYEDIFQKFDKLKYIFKEKYEIEIDKNSFNEIISVSKLKDTIIRKKKLEDIEKIEKELLVII